MHTNTPSYVGTHVTGFSNMVRDFVKHFATKTGTKVKQINILPGWVEPSDMREMKRICAEMGVNIVMLPDTSDVLDTPMTGKHEFYPKGGTTVNEIKSMGDSTYTLACGKWASEDAAIKLENKCKVRFDTLDIPIGIRATDRFIQALSRAGGVKVSEQITAERGRVLDVITDMQQHLYGKRVAIWGDPDQIIPMVEFLLDLDMRPVYIVSGTAGKEFEDRLTELLSERVPEAKFKNGECADMFLLHQWIKQEGVDLLIGNTYGKYIARDENTPLLRYGFPIMDRVGHSYFPNVGYMGALRLVEKILTMFLDKRDAECPEEKFELQL